MTLRSERAAVLMLVLATLLWGGTFVAIRDTVASVAPATLVCLRFGAAAVLLALVLLVLRRAPTRRDLLIGAGSGLLALGGFVLQAEGLRSTSAGSSAFLTCAGTLLAAFFAWPLLGQRPTRMLSFGILLALAGSALLSLRGGLTLGRGELLTLLGSAIYALQIVMLGRFASGADPIAVTCAQSLTVALLLAPFARDAGSTLAAFGAPGWMRFAYLAVAGSTLAPLLQVSAQRALPAGRVALLFALEPVFALCFALTLGAERFAARWWLGAALILSAVVLVEWRAARAAEPSTLQPASR